MVTSNSEKQVKNVFLYVPSLSLYATEVAGTTSVTLYLKNPLLTCAKNLENKMTVFCCSFIEIWDVSHLLLFSYFLFHVKK